MDIVPVDTANLNVLLMKNGLALQKVRNTPSYAVAEVFEQNNKFGIKK
ncbi:MAG: hypothetical protein LBH34_02195 [Prevotellaceae bacterium]|nr:hypothetical protein [Prevotellaceae bacterium]